MLTLKQQIRCAEILDEVLADYTAECKELAWADLDDAVKNTAEQKILKEFGVPFPECDDSEGEDVKQAFWEEIWFNVDHWRSPLFRFLNRTVGG
tara:strand:+ start:94 stop:375 length:282 start_codon:yes stop_codon:yes gene_type:complete